MQSYIHFSFTSGDKLDYSMWPFDAAGVAGVVGAAGDPGSVTSGGVSQSKAEVFGVATELACRAAGFSVRPSTGEVGCTGLVGFMRKESDSAFAPTEGAEGAERAEGVGFAKVLISCERLEF